MKKNSIRKHGTIYSILQKRKTTINHAFASALAPVSTFDIQEVAAALRTLGQDPDADLICVYCDRLAETWDHLVGLVEKSELRGYGHQLGNLVPCCRSCNSRKGAKDWQVYLRATVGDDAAFDAKRSVLASYLEHYAAPVNLEQAAILRPAECARYREVRLMMFSLMAEADEIASELRRVIVSEPVKKSRADLPVSRSSFRDLGMEELITVPIVYRVPEQNLAVQRPRGTHRHGRAFASGSGLHGQSSPICIQLPRFPV
jgi:hypothetical protein